jgi:monovalent cation:H+ antiporter-2, CPA2 family
LGATRYRARIEALALPMRDIFAAFFFLNFGLALNPSTFGTVLIPVAVAVVMTLVVNTAGGQLIAWQNKLTPAQGFNVSAMLQNRGEFALILATLASGAGLDDRLTPFAGLYVLSMAIIGPILAVNSEKMGAVIFRTRRRVPAAVPVGSSHGALADENFALVEAAMAGESLPTTDADELEDTDEIIDDDSQELERTPTIDPLIEQAMQQSDEVVERQAERQRDPEY